MALSSFQTAGRGRAGGAAFTVGLKGTDESLRILGQAGASIHGLESGRIYAANSNLRQAAKRLSQQVADDTIRPLILAGRAPQSAKIADTLRTKVDRKPVIVVGAVNPKLSGFGRRKKKKRHRPDRSPPGIAVQRNSPGGTTNKRYKGSLAWGIEYGPGYSPPNRYKIHRSSFGHILGPAMPRIVRRIRAPYQELVRAALEQAGVTSWGRS